MEKLNYQIVANQNYKVWQDYIYFAKSAERDAKILKNLIKLFSIEFKGQGEEIFKF